MQHGKVTKKVEQIEKIASSSEKITENIYSVMGKFGINKILMPLNKLKRSGTPNLIIMTTLIILPFINKNSIWSFFIRNKKYKKQGGKDAYYNLKNNPQISWRTILYGIAKRFIFLLSDKHEEQKARIKALIPDDTVVEKTGNHIEGTSYVYDHVLMNYVLGYKVLVSGYWDGYSFIPIDFSVHREKRDKEINKGRKRKEKKNEQIRKTKQEIKKKNEQIKSIEAGIKIIEKKNNQSSTKTNQKLLKAKKDSLTKKQRQLEVLKKQLTKQQEAYQYLENAYEERKANHKKYGLSKKEIREQFKKKRARNDFGYKRKKELDTNKIDSAISLIKRAISKGFKFDYILTDSWFFCGKILKYIVSHSHAHLISMAKIGISKYKILRKTNITRRLK